MNSEHYQDNSQGYIRSREFPNIYFLPTSIERDGKAIEFRNPTSDDVTHGAIQSEDLSG